MGCLWGAQDGDGVPRMDIGCLYGAYGVPRIDLWRLWGAQDGIWGAQYR